MGRPRWERPARRPGSDFSTAALAAGPHTITADYSGDAAFTASNGTTVETVQAAASRRPPRGFQARRIRRRWAAGHLHGDRNPCRRLNRHADRHRHIRGRNNRLADRIARRRRARDIHNHGIGAGEHTITAAYSGDAQFASSSGTTVQTVQAASPAKTSTTLGVSSPNPSTVGQPVTFIATVTQAAGSTGMPTGTITFRDGTTVLQTVALGAGGHASFTTTKLSVGPRTITAVYSGDAAFATSTGTAGESVNAVAGAAPSIVNFQRFGFHMHPTVLVLTFNQQLSVSSAEDTRNYRIVGLAGHHIKIRRAVYDPATMTVTLHPAERLSLHHPYGVTLIGTGSNALSSTNGRPLDSAGIGQPGVDHRIELTGRNLVLAGLPRKA